MGLVGVALRIRGRVVFGGFEMFRSPPLVGLEALPNRHRKRRKNSEIERSYSREIVIECRGCRKKSKEVSKEEEKKSLPCFFLKKKPKANPSFKSV